MNPNPRQVAAQQANSELGDVVEAHEEGHADEGHAHKPSHGGRLVELGDHFATVEFVLDGEAGTLTAYVMDGCAEKAVRLAQAELDIELASLSRSEGKKPVSLAAAMAARASALSGETVGDSACFELSHEALKGATAVSGTIKAISVKGSEFNNVKFEAESAR